MARDPRRHQSTTPRHRRSRHPRTSSLHDERRRRIPTSATVREDLASPRYATPQSRERVDLSSFFIMNFLARTCLSGFSLISLSLLGFRAGSSLFGILFVKPFLFVNLFISMSMFRLLGPGPHMGPFPSWPILGSIRGEGTPPTNPSRHLRKEKEFPPSRVAAHGRSGKESNRHHRRSRSRRHYRYRRHSLPRPRGRRCCRRRATPPIPFTTPPSPSRRRLRTTAPPSLHHHPLHAPSPSPSRALPPATLLSLSPSLSKSLSISGDPSSSCPCSLSLSLL